MPKIYYLHFERTCNMTPRSRWFLTQLNIKGQGRIQDFYWWGSQRIMCSHAHYERGTELTFGRGPVAPPPPPPGFATGRKRKRTNKQSVTSGIALESNPDALNTHDLEHQSSDELVLCFAMDAREIGAEFALAVVPGRVPVGVDEIFGDVVAVASECGHFWRAEAGKLYDRRWRLCWKGSY